MTLEYETVVLGEDVWWKKVKNFWECFFKGTVTQTWADLKVVASKNYGGLKLVLIDG
jgi:hypothetical protein